YYRLIHRETTGLLGAFSQDADFSALFANGKGDAVGEIEHLTSAQGDDKWSQAQFDVSKYAGKTLRLTFSAENPRGTVSSMFVDDVMLVACTTGSGPAAPQPSSNNTVYLAGTITNADTGRGVEGAQLFFLKPGLSASDAAADDTVTRDEVQTVGVTDGKGYYQ